MIPPIEFHCHGLPQMNRFLNGEEFASSIPTCLRGGAERNVDNVHPLEGDVTQQHPWKGTGNVDAVHEFIHISVMEGPLLPLEHSPAEFGRKPQQSSQPAKFMCCEESLVSHEQILNILDATIDSLFIDNRLKRPLCASRGTRKQS